MKKITFLGLILGILLVFSGCAFLLVEQVDFEKIPKPIQVNQNSPFYTSTPISFTGNPESDFGASRKFFNKNDGSNWTKVNSVYVAFSETFLYIGHKNTADSDDPPGYLKRGAFYIFIDNGITNGNGSKGMKKLTAGDSGIVGAFDMFDDIGISTVGDRKFSVFVKHYRPFQYSEPTGENIKIYRFVEGAIEKEFKTGLSGGLAWRRYITNNVTEIAIPWSYIFGRNPAYIPDKIYLEFRVDDAKPGPDPWDFEDFATNVTTTNVISNWLELRIK